MENFNTTANDDYGTPTTSTALIGCGDILSECLAKYGSDHQFMMMAEECSELTQAAMKLHRVKDDPEAYEKALDHLAEEMADVRIMIEQIAMMLGNDEQIAKWVSYKLARTRSRIAAA